MKETISITGNLSDIFVMQAIKENLCLVDENSSIKIEHLNYIKRKGRYTDKRCDEGFSKISQMMLLYDWLSFPTVFYPYVFSNKFENSVINETSIKPCCIDSSPIDLECLSYDRAHAIKPIIMSALNNINYSEYFHQFAKRYSGSIGDFFSTLYDYIYTDSFNFTDDLKKILILSSDIGNRIADGEYFDYPCDQSCLLYATRTLKYLIREMLLLCDIRHKDEFDIYSELFNDFHSSKNKEDAYGILKIEISKIMTLQPHFNSIREIMSYKKHHKKALEDFRCQIKNLEYILRTESTENAINVAIKNVRLANEALIKNTPSKQIARIATYVSIPATIVDYLTTNTCFSPLVGVVGTIAQIKSDIQDKKSDWLFIAR